MNSAQEQASNGPKADSGTNLGFSLALYCKLLRTMATAYQSTRRHNPQELNFKFPAVPTTVRAENDPDGSVPFVEKN